MDYQQTIDFLFSLQKFGIKFGLSSTENLLAALGRPHEHLPCLHLAGTNGKGSVGATIVAILEKAGYKVGFYTSPHLISFRERFVINNEMISQAEVIDLARRVQAVMVPEEPPTFFEFVTAMAFLYFAEKKVDLTVLETGMGGRLDATNVVDPLVGVITNISIEHTAYLGRTLTDIAREKAGIIKPGRPVVTGERRPKIRELFESISKAANARLISLGRDFRVRARTDGTFDYFGLGIKIKSLTKKLLGQHQVTNAALAMAALELLRESDFNASEEDIRSGLMNVNWPGRAELIRNTDGQPDLMLDGAHNPAAARVLAELLARMTYQRIHLVLGIMADKDIPGIMTPLLPLADQVYLAQPDYFRSADPQTLAAAAKGSSKKPRLFTDIKSAIHDAQARAKAGDLILVTGSLFTVGEARELLFGSPEPRLVIRG